MCLCQGKLGYNIEYQGLRAMPGLLEFVQFLSLVVQFTHLSDVLPEDRFVLYLVVQPVLNPMRFQIRLILKNARHGWLIWSRQYPA